MTDPISRLSQVMALLLRRPDSNISQRAGSSAKTADSTAAGHTAAPARPAIEDLRRRIQERVRAIDPDDPRRRQRAARAFLESVLVWEFGDRLLLDAGFEDMLTDIQQSFSLDPDAARQLDELLEEMARP